MMKVEMCKDASRGPAGDVSPGGRGLPHGWCWSTVGELAQLITSGSRGWAAYYSDHGPLFLRVGNLDHGSVTLDLSDTVRVQPPAGAEGVRTRVQPGDILLSITADVGMVAVAPEGLGDAYINQHVALIRLSPSLCPRAVAYSLLDPIGFQKLVRKAQYGATKAGLNLNQVRSFRIPVPPNAEQTRIVEAIETQLTRLDAAVVALERVQANLKRYRASVLKAAVEGRLVPTEAELARREGRAYEPASVLLQRVLAERRRRWEEAELAALKVKGTVPKDDKWKARYKQPIAPETVGLPKLADGWCWASLGQLAWAASYGTSTKCNETGSGEPVLRIPNVSRAAIDRTDLKYAISPLGIGEHEYLDVGDFLIIRTNGSRSLIARAALVEERFEPVHFFASYLIRFRLVLSEPLGRWLLAFWHSPKTRALLEASAATSAGQYNVSMSSLEKQAIPLPPLAEQARIAAALDEGDVRVRRLSGVDETQLRRIDRLRQSILKWAFEGKLVDQDPNDEPASVLLDRIRAERTASASRPKARSTTRPRARLAKTARRARRASAR